MVLFMVMFNELVAEHPSGELASTVTTSLPNNIPLVAVKLATVDELYKTPLTEKE